MSISGSLFLLHVIFASVWTGSVIFLRVGVLPIVIAGSIDPVGSERIVTRIQWLSRVSALITLVTGGHMAARLYTSDTLVGTYPGLLVLLMTVGWLGLITTLEIGSVKAKRELRTGKKRQPGRVAKPFFTLCSVFALGLLIIPGLFGVHRIVPLW